MQSHLLRRVVDVSRSMCTTHTHMISFMTDMLKEKNAMEIRFTSYSKLTSEDMRQICMSTNILC